MKVAKYRYKIRKNNQKNFNPSLSIKYLNDEARLKRKLSKVTEVSYSVFSPNNREIGTIIGYLFYGSLIIDVLLVHKDNRGKGLGTALVNKIEQFACKNDSKFMIVNTMDWWDAHKFYEKLGYTVEFIRDGYQSNSKMYSMIKHLDPKK